MAFNDMFSNSWQYHFVSELEAITLKKQIENQANTFIFPFTIYTGFQAITNAGEQTINATPENYSQFSRAFTGDEGIVAVWDNSLILDQELGEDGKPLRNYFNKTLQKGKSFFGRIDNSTTSVDFQSVPGANYLGNYTDWQSTKRYVIDTTYHIQEKDLYKFYMIPELTENDSNTRTLLYISNLEVYYDSKGRFVYNRILFVSLNDNLAQTGQSLFQTVQFSSPGEGYAVPKLIRDATNKVIGFDVDEKYKLDRGIRTIQIEILGPAGFTAPIIYGRPLEVGKVNPVYSPRVLLPQDIKYPIADRISKNSNPESTFYLLDAIPTILSYYDDWKNKMTSDFTDAIVKKFDGFFITTKQDVLNSNKNSLYLKDKDFLKGDGETNILNKPYDVKSNNFFRLNLDDGRVIGLDNFNPSKLNDKNVYTVISLFSFLFRNVKTLPIIKTQSIPWSLASIPVIGNFLEKITLGIPIGWREIDTTNDFPNFLNLLFLMSAPLYSWYIEAFWDSNSEAYNSGAIPLEIFKTGSTDSINGIVNGGSMTTSFLFNLTDRVRTNVYTSAGESATSKIISTSFLRRESLKESGNYYLIGNDFQPTTPFAYDETSDEYDVAFNNGKYIIDLVGFCGVAKAPVRITMWENDPDTVDDLYEEIVYQTTLKTTSLQTDNIRDIWTLWKLSYLEEYRKSQVDFPFPSDVNDAQPNSNVFEEIEDYINISSYKDAASLDANSRTNSGNHSLTDTATIKFVVFDYSKYNTSFAELVKYYDTISVINIDTKQSNLATVKTTASAVTVGDGGTREAKSYTSDFGIFENISLQELYDNDFTKKMPVDNGARTLKAESMTSGNRAHAYCEATLDGDEANTYIALKVDDELKQIFIEVKAAGTFQCNATSDDDTESAEAEGRNDLNGAGTIQVSLKLKST